MAFQHEKRLHEAEAETLLRGDRHHAHCINGSSTSSRLKGRLAFDDASRRQTYELNSKHYRRRDR
jgi:hypothetical protein